MYKKAIFAVAIGAATVAGCSGGESDPIEGDTTSSGPDSGLYEERCLDNDDPVLYDTSVSTMGYAGMTPSELALAISESTADSASDWYSTTNMQITDDARDTLSASVDTVVKNNPNESNYDFTMRASNPNDASTHAWCLSAN